MLQDPDDRRRATRVSIERPCKLYEPRSRKYLAAHTCDVAPGGMLLRVEGGAGLEPGDQIYLGVTQRRRHALIRQDDMQEARVVRQLPSTSGRAVVAIEFVGLAEAPLPSLRAA